MLELKSIVKIYKTGDFVQTALNKVSLCFRENEFVSILGQSGSGKTTMLNIIGGLDRYDDGDLVINGVSTKQYKDSDWDSYRNHKIGFVFQSYNLIPHQSILSNVELALTLSGVSKKQRRQKAVSMLEKVGLANQLHKRPNQLSGGQMQRVAIARALVNDPDILLADEPTGALDSETSLQIMELLKGIAEDRLVIMVTHNPELAKQYSTRIISLKDGKIIGDTDPVGQDEISKAGVESAQPAAADKFKATEKSEGTEKLKTAEKSETSENSETIEKAENTERPKDSEKSKNAQKPAENAKKQKGQKTSMSFFTALSLSLNNLMTKKGRTFMTSFAGSIGIIGIALILSLSSGARAYIDKTERETLSSYPLSVDKQSIDYSSMMSNFVREEQPEGTDKAYTQSFLYDQIKNINSSSHINDLKSFKAYVEQHESDISGAVSDIRYKYSTELYVYNCSDELNPVKANPNTLTADLNMNDYLSSKADSMSSKYMSANDSDLFTELFTDKELQQSYYELLDGKMPENKNEAVLILDKNNRISDYSLYTLGILDREGLKDLMKSDDGEEPDYSDYEYSELLGISFKVAAAGDLYEEQDGIFTDIKDDSEKLSKKLKDAESLTIVGIAKYTDDASKVGSFIGGMVGYLPELSDYIMDKNNNTAVLKAQQDNPDTDVLTGNKFKTAEEIESEIENFDISTVPPQYQMMFANLSGENLKSAIRSYVKMTSSTATYDENLEALGYATLDDPSGVEFYCSDFEGKDKIVQFIKDYNASVDEQKSITYTDYVGLMMSSVTTIINAISYILIAFVAISLVVSSIMIGIITYISVLERTKEIGILRSIGASKKDISRVFNAETMIVGFVAGIIGILVTLLLNVPINLIVEHLTDIAGISALPPFGGVILVVISVILTLIAGLIPSSVAAKKDPVEALRSE